jgi:hypothetical protein
MDNIPLIKGRDLTDEEKSLLQTAYDLASQVILAVENGQLTLQKSYIDEGKLFLGSDVAGQYLMVDPKGDIATYMASTGEVIPAVSFDNIDNAVVAMTAWLNM